MSIPRITGRQARDLLDGTTPGPWEARPNGVVVSYATGAQIQLVGHNQRALGDAPLMAAAPALAETVAWLYGREPDGPGAHVHRGRTDEYDQEAVASRPETGVVEVYVAHDHGQVPAFLTPDDAVDLARALLAAAEEARP